MEPDDQELQQQRWDLIRRDIQTLSGLQDKTPINRPSRMPKKTSNVYPSLGACTAFRGVSGSKEKLEEIVEWRQATRQIAPVEHFEMSGLRVDVGILDGKVAMLNPNSRRLPSALSKIPSLRRCAG